LGNKYAQIIIDRVMPRVEGLYSLPEFGDKFKTYVEKRVAYEAEKI
jgi:hypothetical protein